MLPRGGKQVEYHLVLVGTEAQCSMANINRALKLVGDLIGGIWFVRLPEWDDGIAHAPNRACRAGHLGFMIAHKPSVRR